VLGLGSEASHEASILLTGGMQTSLNNWQTMTNNPPIRISMRQPTRRDSAQLEDISQDKVRKMAMRAKDPNQSEKPGYLTYELSIWGGYDDRGPSRRTPVAERPLSDRDVKRRIDAFAILTYGVDADTPELQRAAQAE
jgi:hypothetical protein